MFKHNLQLPVLFPPLLLLLYIVFFSILQLAYSFRETMYFGAIYCGVCMVFWENCKNSPGASGLWLLPPHPQPVLRDGRGSEGSPHGLIPRLIYPHALRQAILGLWICLLTTRLTSSTWRKFFSIRAINLCSSWSLAEEICLERAHTREGAQPKGRGLLLV